MAGLTWHSAQSLLKTAWRSAWAAAILRVRSILLVAGAMSCGGGMVTLTINCFMPEVLSTVTVLTIVPLLPRRSTLTLIGPLVPAPRCQGCSGSLATVHPQE